MNITDYHPLKCKYTGSYWLFNPETKKFEAYSCSECLKANAVEDQCEDSYFNN